MPERLERRTTDNEYLEIRQELAEFHEKLSKLDSKVGILTSKVTVLDDDFRLHEAYEKSLVDEVILAVKSNTETVDEVRKSVSGYVELQEDLTVLVRFAKKVINVVSFLGKFAIIFGISGVSLSYLYDWILKHYPGG